MVAALETMFMRLVSSVITRCRTLLAIFAIGCLTTIGYAQLRAEESVDDMSRLRQMQALPIDDVATRVALERDQLRNPPYFLYELARRELSHDPATAGQWFIVALVRVRYDALRCKDATAASDVGMLGQIAKDVAGRMQDQSFRAHAVMNALARRDLFAGTTSPLWICSHGLDATQAALAGRAISPADALRPTTEWPAIQTRLREQLAGLAR